MFFGGRFKRESSNDENSISFNNNATSNKLKEDLLSLVDSPGISLEKSTMPPTLVNQKLHLNSGSPFAQMQNVATNEKPKKRPYSKPCPKSRKKKIQDSSFNEEEKNLDNDLLGLVGAISADKNLESDSSNESIEFNDTIYLVDNNPITPQENLFSDVNSLKEKAAPTSAFFDSSLKSFISTDGAKHQTIAVEKKKGVEVKSRVPVFKEIMPTSFSKNNSSSSSSILRSNLLSTESSNENFSVSPKGAKKKKSEVLEDNTLKAGTSAQSSLSNNNSGVCQSSKNLSYQSIYASMGLDEDLCDTEQASSKASNSASKETIELTSSPEKFDNLSEVKVKTEKVSSPDAYSDKRTKDDKNENLTLDGYHVSWTFEAETPCDDGEEEDVPLMLLKNKPADVIKPQIKSASNDLSHKVTSISDKTSTVTGNKIDNFHPSLFIKKELIEDEIVSESPAVSANIPIFNSNDKSNMSTNSPVKIKSEPIDSEYFSENYTKTNVSTSLELSNNQFSACSSIGLSEKTPPKKQKNSATSKSSTPTDNSKKNYILARLLMDVNPSIYTSSAKTNTSSNIIAENANSSVSELLDSSKPVTKKPVSKKKKVVKKKATNVIEGLENSSAQFAQHAELPQIPQTPDSGNLLTDSASNSNNFNADDRSAAIAKIDDAIEAVIRNSELLEIPQTPDRDDLLTDSASNSNNFNVDDRSAAIAKIDETIESVIRNSVIDEHQLKGKTKGTSKKPVIENISLSTLNSEILANDKTSETQEKTATDSETDTALETDTAFETDIQINPANAEKRKRESIEKDMNIDENLPITLLIKRQKTDTDSNPAGSFLCTSITSKSSTVESSSVYNDTQGLDIDECEEMPFLSGKKDLDSNILSSEISSIPKNTKKKKTGKKKSKKKAKRYQQINLNPLSAVAENESVSTDFSSTPIKESDSPAYTALEENFSEKNKVRTGKNSSFYPESATVDGFTDLSSQDNLYTALSSCDARSEESFSSTSFQTSVSGRSETNNLNSLSVPSKKKKRVRRSNGWYKKKKSKKEKQRSRKNTASVVDKVEIQNPILDASTDPLLLTGKTPIVVIKNLNAELHNIGHDYMKAIHNIAEIQNAESNRAKISSEILEKLPVTSSSKVQKKKGNKSRKKTQPQASLKNNYIENEDEDTLEALPVSESDKISANDSIETVYLQDELSDTSKEISKNNSLEENINKSNVSSSRKKDMTKEVLSESDGVAITGCQDSSVNSNVITNRRGGFFASLNVEAFEKQIEELEAIIGSQNNRDHLRQNTPNSNLKAAEIQNMDESITLIEDTNKDLPGSSKNSDSVLNSIASFQTCNTIPVKREINNDNAENSVNQVDENTSYLNPFRAALSDQEPIANATRKNSISPLICLKKEKDFESQSLHKNVASKQIESCTSISSANKTDSLPNPEYCTSLNSSHTSNVNNIGLTIKRELTHNAKSVSNNTQSFRDQSDLIQQVHASTSKQSSTNLCDTSSKRDFRRYLPDSQLDPIPQSQEKPLELLNDDEIQIIPREAKEIPLIELDDEDDLCNPEKRIQDKISDYDAITSISSKFIELSKQIKTEKDDPKANSVIPEVSNEIVQTSNSAKQISSFSFSKSDQTQDLVDPSKVRTVVSDSNFVSTENYASEDPIKRETKNPFIVKDKYINEYFKHPFPPSQTCYKKRRNRSKIYERIESTAWNLSLDEVESRLKHSENTLPQFGKKLGDIVKLEKYPVSKSEVECYHRILGVAPSHKLLSKCYLTPNQKFLTGFNSLLNRFEQSEMGAKGATHLSINDLLQGITESKIMSNNFDGSKIAFDRDCPSAETRDSFDSSVSHSTDKYVNVIPDKNMEQSSSTLKQNELNSIPENISLISQNSSLCISNSEDVSNNAINNIDTSSNASAGYDASSVIKSNEVSNLSYLQNNILANLNLPSKEVVNSILNSAGTSASTTIETSDTTPKCITESTNITTTVNNESSLPPSYSHLETGVSSETNTNVSKTSTNTNNIFDMINFPVLELRKILDTAKTLPSTTNDNDTLQPDKDSSTLLHANNVNSDSSHSNTVNRDVIEYNHTSIPNKDSDSIQDTEVPKAKDGFSESNEDIGEQTGNENSDDEYVDNEPMHYNSDNDSSSHENEEEPEEPPIPQYKSKWEKIMERKSQELKQKEKINELYLKDCVPVSSRLKPLNKRNSVYNVSEVVDKKLEQPKDNESSKIKKNKSDNKKLKQFESKKKTGAGGEKVNESKKKTETKGEKTNESNKKTGTESVKTNKSQKTSKKVDKQNSKTNDPTAAKKESSKNKSKKPDEVPNLFEVPDKLVKTSPVKNSAASAKSNEKPKFYGNRVTNRGSFLTEATPAKDLKIKIPKKKVPEITKKPASVRSDEFHSMVKSPDINIDVRRMNSGRNFNRTIDNRKNSEEYRSPLSNPSPSFTPHFIRTKKMRDRQNAYLNSRSPFAGRNAPQNKKPLLPEPYPESSPYLNDETVQNRSPFLNTPSTHHQENFMGAVQNRTPLLNTPSTHHQENFMGQKIPVLCSPLSNSSEPHMNAPSNPHQENSIGHKIPVLCSSSSQAPSDPTPSTEVLQKIMSIFNKNEVEDNMLSNSESIDATWNNPYNSPYVDAESSIAPNTNLQPNLPFDSMAPVSNPFRNISQVDSLNLQRPPIGPQHNFNLPFNSVPPINTLDPRRASLGLQSNVLSNAAMPGSPALTETLDPRRAALGLQPRIPIGTSTADSLDPRRTPQPNLPAVSMMSTNLINIPLSENLDPRKAALINNKKQLENPFNSGSQILNSPPHMATPSQQPPRKATCLVPSHLKTLVGHETIETYNVRLLMLEWSVDWLIQQQKLHDPPPISNALKKVSSSYDSFEDYYNTYFPLMLLETWHRIYVSWTHLNQTAPFLCQINSYSVKNHYVSVECQTLFSTDNRRKGVFPDEGSILMVKYSTKSNEYTIKILGYVTQVKTRRYNSVTDSKICSSLTQHINVNQDSLQILTLTFMGAYNSEDIDKRQPVRIHVLCTVKHNLKQNDAMLYINKSPLQRSILNPVADGLLTFSLTPRNSPEEKVNECVRDITKGILSPHPLPLLTVVRAKPESDRLNIIPLLIQKMKTAYKTKVLLCVRTVRALGDIAANICLQQSLKLVIINKRCDTNLQFQKFLLDELVACEAKKMEEGAIGDKKLSSDACIKIKKQIIKDCDVILSLIRNSHDDFLDQTFHETDSIAQMCCIVDEANLCTEPETLIPILHGISKLILIGDPDYTAKVLSKTASAYDFNQSFFQRAYDLDLLTE